MILWILWIVCVLWILITVLYRTSTTKKSNCAVRYGTYKAPPFFKAEKNSRKCLKTYALSFLGIPYHSRLKLSYDIHTLLTRIIPNPYSFMTRISGPCFPITKPALKLHYPNNPNLELAA